MTSKQNRFSVGDTIDGKYEVVKVLPVGGMGELYKVRHIHLNDFRAVKVLKSQMLSDNTQKQRFLREAKIAASIKHPNLASLFDFSSLPDGSYYMVQEFIDGVTLIERMRSGETFDVPFVLRLGQQVLGGLASLHEEGIIHRDISPDNLMLTKTNSGSTTIKIIDLGIAKPVDAGEGLTNAGFFVGKLHYASPEQAGMIEPGEKVDHRTDLYSLGVVLYQMVARRMPFAADNPQAYFLKQVSEEVAPINRPGEAPVVPVELEQFILKLLRKNRKERFASATEALNELVMLSARLSTVAPSFMPDDTSRNLSESPLAASAIAAGPARADDTDVFGNSIDAPVFSDSLDEPAFGHQSDRTTAELPLINGISGAESGHSEGLDSTAAIPGFSDRLEEAPAAEIAASASGRPSSGPKTEALLMSDPARAFFLPDQEPTKVQEFPLPPEGSATASAESEYPSTVVQPIMTPPQPEPSVSPRTMMEDDPFSSSAPPFGATVVENNPYSDMNAPPRVGATVVQSMDATAVSPGAFVPPPPAAPYPAVPAKRPRRSGAIWVIAIIFLLFLAAVVFAALRFLPFGGDGDSTETATATIAENQTGTQDSGVLIPVATPTPAASPGPEVDPLDLLTQTAFDMGTTMGPDFVPTPTPRSTPRTRATPRTTPTPSVREVATPTPTPPPATPPPVREGDLVEQGSAGVTDARVSRWSPPRYPRAAERQGAEGTTTLRVLVGPNGALEDVRVTTSSGFKVLDDEAINVARKSTFAPASKGGVRVRMWIPVRVTFQRP